MWLDHTLYTFWYSYFVGIEGYGFLEVSYSLEDMSNWRNQGQFDRKIYQESTFGFFACTMVELSLS